MRKLRLFEHISLDGVIQHTPDENGFPYGDWTEPYRSPAGRDAVIAAHGERFDLLLGRRTYDLWSGHWRHMPSSPLADGINGATKYVATHRPESLGWGPAQGVGPDMVDDVRRLKAEDGPDLILWGSAMLTSALLEHGVADELVLFVYPVLLGTGKRLFAEGTPPRTLETLSTEAFLSGVVVTVYRVGKAIQAA